jgi:hypothetical protein
VIDWKIPPLGYCVTCQIAYDRQRPAMSMFKGTSLCVDHLKVVLAKEVEAAVEHEDAPEDEESEPVETSGWRPPTDPESDIVRRTAY